ncbi:MAG: hypothetical protein ACLR0U_02025 [Enterocloster clostridioformis]
MKPEIKKLLILNLPYLLFVWLFDKVGAAVRLSPARTQAQSCYILGTVLPPPFPVSRRASTRQTYLSALQGRSLSG